MLQRQGCASDADKLYSQIVDEDPQHVGALHMRGVLSLQRGRPQEARDYLQRSVDLQPDRAAAYSDLGNALQVLGRAAEALGSYERAIEIAPGSFEAHFNKGVALQRHGQLDAAMSCYDRALELRPAWNVALIRRALLMTQMQRLPEACAAYERCLEADPANIDALSKRAQLLRRLGRLDEAGSSAEAALKLHPENPEALLVRAQVLADLGQHTAAARSLVRWLRVAPGVDFAQGQRLYLQSTVCDWSDYEDTAREICASVQAGRRVTTPRYFVAVSGSPTAQLICARTFTNHKYPKTALASWQGERYEHEKIRVAYVSSRFDSPGIYAGLARVLEHRDRSRFNTVAISLQPLLDSSIAQRTQGAFDEFLDQSASSAETTAAFIRSREIDVLVDLTGCSSAPESDICALRAAPVQVNYIGLPGTTGAPFMDYILADEFVIPAEARAHYTEKVVWLPGCHRSVDSQFDRVAGPPPTRLAENAVVLCCFNNNYKLNPTSFDVWMRVLEAVPGSLLWLLADNEDVEANLRARAQLRGLNPSRLVFAARVPHAQHLERLQCADLFLDTFPFSAGGAAGEALEVGLPVLTWPGEAFAARTAASQLLALNMIELIADSLQDYEARAIELAGEPAKLADIRDRLLRLRTGGSLFDTERHCRHLEWAYTRMVEQLRNGQRPEPFTVPPQDLIQSQST